MLKRNFLKEKLAAGQVVIGTWSIIPSPVVADIIASAGVDFVVIDGEHGPISFETAQNMIMACESRGVSAGMRVPGVIEVDILKALDIGSHFLHIPNIKSKKDIDLAIAMMKYPPSGNRGFSPFTRAGNYSLDNAKKLTKIANESVLLAVHIEGKEAIDNIDDILSVKDLDIVFVGVFDLSKSLGIPGDISNPKVKKLLKKVADQVTQAGKCPATIVNNQKQLKEYKGYGIKYFTYSIDCDVLNSAYKQIIREGE